MPESAAGPEAAVNRSGGIVSLKAVEKSLRNIEACSKGTEKHAAVIASEVKLKTINKRIRELERYLYDGNYHHGVTKVSSGGRAVNFSQESRPVTSMCH